MLFTIEAEYTVPTYVRFAVDAETEAQALTVGGFVADDVNGDDVWANPKADIEASSRITVTIVPDAEQSPEDLPLYHAPERPCEVNMASPAPAIRHVANDLYRSMTDFLQRSENDQADDVCLCNLIKDWRDRLGQSL